MKKIDGNGEKQLKDVESNSASISNNSSYLL